jgi:Protein of unknown function (DUF2568)
VKAAALGVRFLLELAALASLVFAGVALVHGILGWLVGTALAAAAGVAWGLVVAPRARLSWPTPARLAVEVAVFVVAASGLLLAGYGVAAAVLSGVYLLDRLALWAAGAPPYEAPR